MMGVVTLIFAFVVCMSSLGQLIDGSPVEIVRKVAIVKQSRESGVAFDGFQNKANNQYLEYYSVSDGKTEKSYTVSSGTAPTTARTEPTSAISVSPEPTTVSGTTSTANSADNLPSETDAPLPSRDMPNDDDDDDKTTTGASGSGSGQSSGSQSSTPQVGEGNENQAKESESAHSNSGAVSDTVQDSSSCVDPALVGQINKEVVKTILRRDEGVWTPYSNFDSFSQLNFLLTGQQAKSEDELKHLCLRTTFSHDALVTHGYEGVSTKFADCTKTESGLCGQCERNYYKSDNNTQYDIWIQKYSAVWTDDEKAALVVLCLSNEKKVWVLYSTEQSTDQEQMKIVLEKVAQFGLGVEKSFLLNYDGCHNM